ncbi:ABC transporter ATP-binding protein [Sulfitobacter sp. EhC04]|uniref:ABC transporter ATP-binding protein n=1 Tax=Sulfitobacter sp. EhC04 TaxID=1849168 RepID=UPI0007F4B550|nr:ABC transporter ATP-binding protein [Sulfitobacter sp. EhC04]OAN75718.1 ABC transporter ATP-binding protein [Sulfitobacter sp. EhC04]
MSAFFEIKNLEAGYGNSKVLFDVSLKIAEGEFVTLMGRNGMGKSTTIRSIMGILKPTAGEIYHDGTRIDGLASHKIAKRGIGFVPEGRHIFPNLSVRENLLMAQIKRGSANEWDVDSVFDFFPRLAERMSNGGDQLSGGEQQMLAIGRALMTNPYLLILDEATEGLAPIIRDEIWDQLGKLKAMGVSILIVDKELDALSELADHHFIIEKGEIVWQGDNQALMSNPAIHEKFLGV